MATRLIGVDCGHKMFHFFDRYAPVAVLTSPIAKIGATMSQGGEAPAG